MRGDAGKLAGSDKATNGKRILPIFAKKKTLLHWVGRKAPAGGHCVLLKKKLHSSSEVALKTSEGERFHLGERSEGCWQNNREQNAGVGGKKPQKKKRGGGKV